MVADQAREPGGAAGEQLGEARRVRSGEVDAAVARVPEMEHGVATAEVGGLLFPLGERAPELWVLIVNNGIWHSSTLTRNYA
ncbi:hypothetical protein JCM18882A_28830 [Brevibacterium metallidurans]|uniref:Uncharacterized protein n=1 Tax=Brevibacterium metallidurans TaxID=1482676 RepID=A0ABN0SMH1_9MICO